MFKFCLKAIVFLVTIGKWGISGQGYKQLTRLSRFVLFKPAASTILSAVLIFVTEDWFIYIYFRSFEENHRNRISRAGKKISPTISLFFP